VDVVQRVAEIATKDLVPDEADPYGETAERICINTNEHNIQDLKVEVTMDHDAITGQQTKWYLIFASGFYFSVNVNTGEIYEVDTSGLNDPSNPIGLLK
jgi:hypothetical protein